MSFGFMHRWIAVLLLLFATQSTGSGGQALIIDIDGAIGPATSAFVAHSLHEAESGGAAVLVLRLDTPGGLDSSMRAIVKAINASSVPVVGYVAPSGARAASAGTYILYACHVAAMAPGTNLGAATPVQIGGLGGGEAPKQPLPGAEEAEDETKSEEGDDGAGTSDKLVNDAVAYIRSLAQLRGRNAEWAERAVREAASLPAEEALELGVVDLLAADLDELLARIDGRMIEMPAGALTLRTRGLTLVELEPDWQNRLLSIVANPNVAYILLLVGIYGLVYEFSNPGAVLPGTVGAVSLVLGLYAFQLLPINYAGAALMLLGIALMLAEAFVPSFGALGVGGIAAFVVGSLILIDTDAPGFGLSIPLVVTLASLSSVLLAAIITMAVRSRTRPVVSGADELLGASGVALSGFPGRGSIRIHGEVWSARSETPIAAGQVVEVLGRDGMVLRVAPRNSEKESES
jgi:membrane-bound serine protease (ClpP class)